MDFEPESITQDGICVCGCGLPTPLATRTRNGNTKGYPIKWMGGHYQRAHRRGVDLSYQEVDLGFVTPCWITDRHHDELGYATCNGKNGPSRAHIVSYQRVYGSVPTGLVLDHLCRQTGCINPNHLEPVTHAENVRRGKSATITWPLVREIRASSLSQRRLAARYGISRSQVANIQHNRSWIEDGLGSK